MKRFLAHLDEVKLTVLPGSVKDTFLIRVPGGAKGDATVKTIESAIKKSKFTLKDVGLVKVDGKPFKQIRFASKDDIRTVSKALDGILMGIDGVDGITTLRESTQDLIEEAKAPSVDKISDFVFDLTSKNDINSLYEVGSDNRSIDLSFNAPISKVQLQALIPAIEKKFKVKYDTEMSAKNSSGHFLNFTYIKPYIDRSKPVEVLVYNAGEYNIKQFTNTLLAKYDIYVHQVSGVVYIDGKKENGKFFVSLNGTRANIKKYLKNVKDAKTLKSYDKLLNEDVSLDEGKVDVDTMAKKIAKLTDRNDHNEAMIQFAKFLGATKYEKILTHIQAIHNIERSMPSDLSKYRYEVMQSMKVLLKQNFSKEDADKIWGSL